MTFCAEQGFVLGSFMKLALGGIHVLAIIKVNDKPIQQN
jgi:hypothetical protein